MVEMTTSLAQALQSPSEAQAVRAQHSSQAPRRPEFASADKSPERTAQPDQPNEKGVSERKSTSDIQNHLGMGDAPESVSAGSANVRLVRPDFRKLLENRLSAPQTRQTVANRTEVRKQGKQSDPGSAFATSPALPCENSEGIPGKISIIPGRGQNAQLAPQSTASSTNRQIAPNQSVVERVNVAAEKKPVASGSDRKPDTGAEQPPQIQSKSARTVVPDKDKPVGPEDAGEASFKTRASTPVERVSAASVSKTEGAARTDFGLRIADAAASSSRRPPSDQAQNSAADSLSRQSAAGGFEKANRLTESQTITKETTTKETTGAEGETSRSAATADTSSVGPEISAEIARTLNVTRNPARTDAVEQPSATASSAVSQVQSGARAGASNMPIESPAEQIIQSIRLDARAAQQRIDVTLNPSELGMVRMRFQHADGEVNGTLFVDKAQTRYEIEKELPQIIAAMQHNGVQVRRLEVVMQQQNQQHDSHGAQGEGFAEADYGRFQKQAYGNSSQTQDALEQAEERVHDTDSADRRLDENRVTDEAINVYV